MLYSRSILSRWKPRAALAPSRRLRGSGLERDSLDRAEPRRKRRTVLQRLSASPRRFESDYRATGREMAATEPNWRRPDPFGSLRPTDRPRVRTVPRDRRVPPINRGACVSAARSPPRAPCATFISCSARGEGKDSLGRTTIPPGSTASTRGWGSEDGAEPKAAGPNVAGGPCTRPPQRGVCVFASLPRPSPGAFPDRDGLCEVSMRGLHAAPSAGMEPITAVRMSLQREPEGKCRSVLPSPQRRRPPDHRCGRSTHWLLFVARHD